MPQEQPQFEITDDITFGQFYEAGPLRGDIAFVVQSIDLTCHALLN